MEDNIMKRVKNPGKGRKQPSTYDRKYFMNKRVKQFGYKIRKGKTERTIMVKQLDVEEAARDKNIKELAAKHGYGVQIENPILYLVDN